MAKRKKNKIQGRFVPLPYILLESEAFKALSPSARIAYVCFLCDRRNNHQTDVMLTFGQARKKFCVCSSPSTFGKIKKELVDKGFLDPLESGGLNKPSKFDLSERWRQYGSDLFKQVEYTLGVSSKYFKSAWKDKDRRKKLLEARHKNKT